MNEQLQKQLNTLARNVDARTRPEKVILLGVLIAAMALIYLSVSYDPMTSDINRLQSQTANTQRQIAAQQATYAEMVAASQEDPSRFANERLNAINSQLVSLDQEITNLAGDLITPREMTQILTTVLGRYSGLELVSFENKPATPLRSGVQSGAAATAEGETAADSLAMNEIDGQVYEHGLTLEFRGDFFTTLKYLRFLEEVSGSFFWDSVTFRQTVWPNADVTLEIHTLSTDEGFIGV